MRKITNKILILLLLALSLKILGLFYKIFITRMIGIEGMRLIAMITPSLSLALSLSSLSMQAVCNQNISLNIKNKSKKDSIVMLSSLRINIISTSIISILLLLSFPIYKYILNDSFIYYPLLLTIPLLYLSNTSGIMKGYLEAHNKFINTYFSNFLESLFKLIFTIIILFIFNNKPIKSKVIICFLGLSLSEFVSCIYLFIKIKKGHKIKLKRDTKKFEFSILKQAIPLTLDSLVTTIFSYVTPFIFYYISSLKGIPFNESTITYTLTVSYALPLLIHGQFASVTTSKLLFPKITKNRDSDNLNKILRNAFLIILMFATTSFIICTNYSDVLLDSMYHDLSSLYMIKYVTPLFFFIYFNPILTTILQSFNKEKTIFKTTLLTQIIIVILIITLTFNIPTLSYIIGYSIGLFIKFILLLINVMKCIHFKIKAFNLIYSLFYTLSFFIINTSFKNILYFVIVSIIYFLLGFSYLYFLNKNKILNSQRMKHT